MNSLVVKKPKDFVDLTQKIQKHFPSGINDNIRLLINLSKYSGDVEEYTRNVVNYLLLSNLDINANNIWYIRHKDPFLYLWPIKIKLVPLDNKIIDFLLTNIGHYLTVSEITKWIKAKEEINVAFRLDKIQKFLKLQWHNLISQQGLCYGVIDLFQYKLNLEIDRVVNDPEQVTSIIPKKSTYNKPTPKRDDKKKIPPKAGSLKSWNETWKKQDKRNSIKTTRETKKTNESMPIPNAIFPENEITLYSDNCVLIWDIHLKLAPLDFKILRFLLFNNWKYYSTSFISDWIWESTKDSIRAWINRIYKIFQENKINILYKKRWSGAWIFIKETIGNSICEKKYVSQPSVATKTGYSKLKKQSNKLTPTWKWKKIWSFKSREVIIYRNNFIKIWNDCIWLERDQYIFLELLIKKAIESPSSYVIKSSLSKDIITRINNSLRWSWIDYFRVIDVKGEYEEGYKLH